MTLLLVTTVSTVTSVTALMCFMTITIAWNNTLVDGILVME